MNLFTPSVCVYSKIMTEIIKSNKPKAAAELLLLYWDFIYCNNWMDRYPIPYNIWDINSHTCV